MISTDSESELPVYSYFHNLRILHFCAVDFTVRHFVSPLALDQKRLGAEVMIACSEGDEWDGLLEMGLDMRSVDMPRNLNPKLILKALQQLLKLLKKEKPDVLYLHTPLASLVGRLAGFIARVPTVIYHVHGFYFHERMKRKAFLAHLTLERMFAPLASAMFFVSREDRRTAKKYRMKKKGFLYSTPNGVDPNLYEGDGDETLELLFKNPEGRIVVTFMGRLTEEKGIFEFLEAIEGMASKGLPVLGILAGPVLSSERDSVQRRIDEILNRETTKDAILQIGYCQDVPTLLKQSDVFCLPSWREGLPVSIIEAMMASLPVVTCDVRGCRELVRDGVNGFIVDVKSSDQLSESISLLVKRKNMRNQMGKNSRKIAGKFYSKSVSLQSVHDALGDVLSRRGRSQE